MAGHTPPVDAIGDIVEVRLEDVTSSISQNAATDRAMSVAVQAAIDRATVLPGNESERPNAYEELADGVSSEGAQLRREIESQVQREGTGPLDNQHEADGIAVVAESLTSLMREMTTWQVTWSMAQTAQKDVSHVLKSS